MTELEQLELHYAALRNEEVTPVHMERTIQLTLRHIFSQLPFGNDFLLSIEGIKKLITLAQIPTASDGASFATNLLKGLDALSKYHQKEVIPRQESYLQFLRAYVLNQGGLHTASVQLWEDINRALTEKIAKTKS